MVIRALLAMAIAATAACSYGVSFVDCEVTCTLSSGCPDGFTCSLAEGLCRSGETTESCTQLASGPSPGVDGGAVADDVGSADPCAEVSLPDGCIGGTLFVCGGTCHVYCAAPLMNWDQANASCDTRGWSMIEINSLAEDTCVDAQIPDGMDTWLGLRQTGVITVDAHWVWSASGTAIPPSGPGFRRWESDVGSGSAPNDAGGASGEDGSQQCASTRGDNSGWDDRECVQALPHLCEKD